MLTYVEIEHFIKTSLSSKAYTNEDSIPVTGVPDPRVPPGLRLKVGPADVVDLGGEAEQAAVSVGPVGLGCRFGQAILLGSAVEHVQRTILDVNRLLDQRGVQDQVRGRWEQESMQDWTRVMFILQLSATRAVCLKHLWSSLTVRADDSG